MPPENLISPPLFFVIFKPENHQHLSCQEVKRDTVLDCTLGFSYDKYEVITVSSPININISSTNNIRQSMALSHCITFLDRKGGFCRVA